MDPKDPPIIKPSVDLEVLKVMHKVTESITKSKLKNESLFELGNCTIFRIAKATKYAKRIFHSEKVS